MNSKLLLKLLHFLRIFLFFIFSHVLFLFLFVTIQNNATHPPSQNNMNVCCCLYSLFFCFKQCGAGNKKENVCLSFSMLLPLIQKLNKTEQNVIYSFV